MSHSPRSTAVTLIVESAIVCPAGLLRRRVKADVTDISSRQDRNTERLDRPVEIFVIQGILIVPDSRSRIGHLVRHKPKAIIAGIRLELAHCRACPCHERRSPQDGGRKRGKCEAGCAADAVLSIGNVVIHVALPGMRLAPCVLMGGDILGFGEVGRALIQVLVQIVGFNPDPMRHTVMRMAAVVVRRRWICASERIDPCARSNAGLAAV